MSNLYKKSEVIGTEHLRARFIQVHNQRGVTPHVSFTEERVTSFAGRDIFTDLGELRIDYNAGQVIELRNPDTTEPMGITMKHQDLMVALYSLYIQLAMARDAATTVTPVVDPMATAPAGGVVYHG